MVTLNPLYAPQGDYSDAPQFKFEAVGDKVYGKITKVGEVRNLTNKKFNPEKDPAYKATYRAQFITIETEEGKSFTVMLTGSQFGAVGEALVAAEQADLVGLEGWGFGMKWDNVKAGEHGMQRLWKARVDNPEA